MRNWLQQNLFQKGYGSYLCPAIVLRETWKIVKLSFKAVKFKYIEKPIQYPSIHKSFNELLVFLTQITPIMLFKGKVQRLWRGTQQHFIVMLMCCSSEE